MRGARGGLLAAVGVLVVGALSSAWAGGSRPGAGNGASAVKAAPLVTLPALKKALKKSQGHPVLLHFWASWCHPCMEELPVVNQFARDMRARGLEVVSISLDGANKGEQVFKVLQERAPDLKPAIFADDAGALMTMIDPQWGGAIPALFALGPKGETRGHLFGESSRQQLEELVGYMLKPLAKKCEGGKTKC